MGGYRRDLAFIHDAGFSDYALGGAPGLLRILKTHKIKRGLVIDLGCGSGRWACELNRAGYDVLGVDQSRAMIRMARRIAPRSRFKVASLLTTELPECVAITSIGECLNYCFDRASGRRGLVRLFKRCYGALRPGGVFICDFATSHRRPKGRVREHRSCGRGWKITARTTAHGRRTIRREIVAFRKVGGAYRRSEETHILRLYSGREIALDLRRCGFRVRVVRRWGGFRFPRGIEGIIAVKPLAAAARKAPPS
ncbi:MAG: class I SAM-dependent methyltransferase [Candidatus Acidiferrales bacterium]